MELELGLRRVRSGVEIRVGDRWSLQVGKSWSWIGVEGYGQLGLGLESELEIIWTGV